MALAAPLLPRPPAGRAVLGVALGAYVPWHLTSLNLGQ